MLVLKFDNIHESIPDTHLFLCRTALDLHMRQRHHVQIHIIGSKIPRFDYASCSDYHVREGVRDDLLLTGRSAGKEHESMVLGSSQLILRRRYRLGAILSARRRDSE